MKRKILSCGFIAVFVAAACSGLWGNMISNCDFTGCTTSSMGAWTATVTASSAWSIGSYDIDMTGPLAISADFRGQPKGMGGMGGMTTGTVSLKQTVNLVAGETYDFSANYLAHWVSANSDPLTVVVNLGGTQIATQVDNLGTAGAEHYTLLTGTYACTTTGPAVLEIVSSHLRVSGMSTAPYAIVDDVSLVQEAAVPEPGTMLLLGTGVLSIAGILRRKTL